MHYKCSIFSHKYTFWPLNLRWFLAFGRFVHPCWYLRVYTTLIGVTSQNIFNSTAVKKINFGKSAFSDKIH